MDDLTYWSALAQVLPVLALAHLVETRSIIRGANIFPGWYRTVVGIFHFVSLAAIGFCIIACLRVLRRDNSFIDASTLQPIVESVVSTSVTVIIAGAMTSAFMLAAASPVALLASANPKNRLAVWRSKRLVRKGTATIEQYSATIETAKVYSSRFHQNHEEALKYRERALKLSQDTNIEAEIREKAVRYISELDAWLPRNQEWIDKADSLIAQAPSIPQAKNSLAAYRTNVAKFDQTLTRLRSSQKALAENRWLQAAGVEAAAVPTLSDVLENLPPTSASHNDDNPGT